MNNPKKNEKDDWVTGQFQGLLRRHGDALERQLWNVIRSAVFPGSIPCAA